MISAEALCSKQQEELERLQAENDTLREEVRCIHRAADITADYVVGQIRKEEQLLAQISAESELRANKNDELSRLYDNLKQVQSQLLQSEKMASIGQLAAGVAHEINNPIGYVISNLKTLAEYAQDLLLMVEVYEGAENQLDPATQARLKIMKQEVGLEFLRADLDELTASTSAGLGRVKRIVQDLRDFSRVDSTDWQQANLERGLDSTLNVAANEINGKAEVVRQYGGIPDVDCIPAQLNQVFMNLLLNAVQAMEGKRGSPGIITIRTGIDKERVWVEVEDNGMGILPGHLSHIFDPFFTTKPVGQGVGLGLSLVHGIVRRHDGEVTVKSTHGQGSCFRVWIPRKRASGVPQKI